MAGDGEWAEGAKVPAILHGQETERKDDKQYGLLMHMPAEKERGVTTKGECTDEVVPARIDEYLDKRRLGLSAQVRHTTRIAYHLSHESQHECHSWADFW